MTSKNENTEQAIRVGIQILASLSVLAFWLYNPSLMEGSDPDWWTSGILPLCVLFGAVCVAVQVVLTSIALCVVVFAAVFK